MMTITENIDYRSNRFPVATEYEILQWLQISVIEAPLLHNAIEHKNDFLPRDLQLTTIRQRLDIVFHPSPIRISITFNRKFY